MADGDKRSLVKNGDLLLALGMLGILIILLVPLPTMMLDLALAMNLSLGLLILLLTMTVKAPLEFSTFPSLLLFTTLFRLSLNVASTRLILGGGDAGRVIAAFGDFVVGGDLIVGMVIFIILLTIQFVVITKGSGRISEVAARFTLDAMPGKQMAIDADLNAGLITEDQARQRREQISSEAEFYGSMDGASKFVRGDAIAGLIITLVNIIGGVVIGISKDMQVSAALQKYAVLTVGDGLVSQIPALVISIAAGILVTKARSDERLGKELTLQVLMSSKAARITGGMVLALALVPGLPAAPFIILSCLLFLLSRTSAAEEKRAEKAAREGPEPPPEEDETGEITPEVLNDLLEVDRISIEIGYRLIPMVEGQTKGGLLDHINMLRRQFAQQHGFVVPPIRVRDNLSLDPNAYRILLSGEEVASGSLYPDHLLAMNPGTATEELQGIATTDPTFGLPATWVPRTERAQAETLGYTVIDPEAVLVTHLTEVIKAHAHEILSREDVQKALDRVKETNASVVNELVPDVLPLGTIQKVLSNLLRERIPIRNLPTILEVLADSGRSAKDPDVLTEAVRQRLARLICESHANEEGKVAAITFEPSLEQQLADSFSGEAGAGAISPDALRAMQEEVVRVWSEAQGRGEEPVLLVRSGLRRHLADLFTRLTPPIPVLSFSEIVSARGVLSAGIVQLQGTGEARPRSASAVASAAGAES